MDLLELWVGGYGSLSLYSCWRWRWSDQYFVSGSCVVMIGLVVGSHSKLLCKLFILIVLLQLHSSSSLLGHSFYSVLKDFEFWSHEYGDFSILMIVISFHFHTYMFLGWYKKVGEFMCVKRMLLDLSCSRCWLYYLHQRSQRTLAVNGWMHWKVHKK
jgi:hypothetical protein